MPGGHQYAGPEDALERYTAIVESASADAEVKGAKNPYTSRNGHMFSFLTPDGMMALRLSDELAEDFAVEYETGPVMQYGSVMRGYVSVPGDLLGDPSSLVPWFDRAWDWIGSLPPK